MAQKRNIDLAAALPKLRKSLADTDDPAFLCMIWAIHAIQDKRVRQANKFLNHPKEAETTDIGSKYAAYKWDLETLITLDLNTPKATGMIKRERLDTRDFNTVANIVNLLRAVEDHETPGRVDDTNVLLEVHRIGHRQFAWQRGFARPRDIYRYLYIYGQGECAAYFQQTYGVSVMDFFTVAFGHFGYLTQGPWMERVPDLQILRVSQDAIDKSLKLLSGDIWAIRRESKALLSKFEKSLGTRLPVIYLPSYLRVKPIIRRAVGLRDRYIAPLPALILLRATMGLYYDLQNGGTTVTNDATKRFEDYARRSIKAHCPDFEPAPAVEYTYKKNSVETPDILLSQGGRIVAVFECKATKLTFEAQYGDDPIENAKNGYSQIAKAIFQLWRFFSHVRRGIVALDVTPDAPAIVLTMDAWGQVSRELRDTVVAEAEKIAAAKEPEITEEDKRRPVFCPIQELDDMLTVSNEEQLLAAFRAATDVYYQGWNIGHVRSDAVPELETEKSFLFDLGEFLPWWNDMRKPRAVDRDAAVGVDV
ncbi:hypothetical protein [Mesorhizobium salmacidum]|uniref:Restriction endonuclease n=1 Tax=Mesorhizobium salmacidum TaxID=3015171 RepID=A0ABU8KXB3_9HYPH